MALVMLTVIGLMVGSALTYSSTSLDRVQQGDPPQPRVALYAADRRDPGRDRNTFRDNPETAADIIGGGHCETPGFTHPALHAKVDVCLLDDSFVPARAPRRLLALGTSFSGRSIDTGSSGTLEHVRPCRLTLGASG